MSDLVSYLSDRLRRFTFTIKANNNKPEDFKNGDKVIILTNDIDSFASNNIYKPGMIGYIDNVIHRYIGQPAEHVEYWTVIYSAGRPVGRSRWNVNELLPYAVAIDLFNSQKQSTSQSSQET